MDNNKFAENLLKADGIDPANITESERAAFRQMLDVEQKRMKRLSWLSVGTLWIFVIALIGLCFSENLLEKLHIPFAVPVIALSTTMVIVMMKCLPAHNKKLEESNKKVSKLHYLVHGSHRGFALISRKGNQRIIHWPSLFILTVVLWLGMSLAGAGVYYIMCQRWIYTSLSEAMWIHIFLTTVMPLGFLIGILRQGLKAPLEELVEIKSKPSKPGYRPDIWRIIMHSKMTKPIAAAIIIIAVMLTIELLPDSSGGKLYAAVAKAMQNINTVHVTGWTTHLSPSFSISGDEPRDSEEQYPVEQWEWFTEDGNHRHYEMTGPIINWNDDTRSYEYQKDYDRLWIDVLRSKFTPQTLTVKFQCMEAKIDPMKQKGKITTLGKRSIQGQEATGMRWEHGGTRKDIWLNKDHLLLESNRYKRIDNQWKQYGHFVISYDQDVPKNIRICEIPSASEVHYTSQIDPKFEKWNNRLLQIARYYQSHPLPQTMELLPRLEDEPRWDRLVPAYAPGKIPGKAQDAGFWAIPMSLTLGDCILQWGGDKKIHLRVPMEIRDIPMNHDLITRNDHTQMQRVEFIVDTMGYKLVQEIERRTVWIARYDGRPLKPWKDVKAPVPNPHNVPLKPGMMSSAQNPQSAHNLFEAFNYYQNYNLTAEGVIIIDETGLPYDENDHSGKHAICSESVYWDNSNESLEIAKKWFGEQFGITFTEEIRPMEILVVCEK